MDNTFKNMSFEQAKQEYRKLVFMYHPDTGGVNANPEMFNKVKNDFDEFVNNYNKKQTQSGQKTADISQIIFDLFSDFAGSNPELLDQLTQTSLYKVAASGIISDMLNLIGKKDKSQKAKGFEDILRGLTQ